MNLKRLIFLLIFFNAVAWWRISQLSNEEFLYFDFFAVGQGDAEMVSVSGRRILIDGGPGGEILPELEKVAGRKKYIDVIILTHPHADHYFGLSEVIGRYEVGIIIMPEVDNDDPAFGEFISLAERKNIPVIRLASGDRIRSEDFAADVLSPADESLSDANARSLVVLFSTGGIKALFTGDIGSKQELKIVDECDIDADILKVPHHGSSGSSSKAFLDEISPAVSVVEVGAGNRYGFPKENVLKRLKAAGSIIYRTDTDGSIRITPFKGKLKITKLE